jgi:hypothetical protein
MELSSFSLSFVSILEKDHGRGMSKEVSAKKWYEEEPTLNMSRNEL